MIAEVEAELAHLSVRGPWAEQVTYLIQLPGIGLLTAMTIASTSLRTGLSAMGDVFRFPIAKKLVGYGGFGTRIHASGQTCRTGSITKQGRREPRAAMVEAAWAAVRHYPQSEARFRRLEKRIGKLKAIVAVARKLTTWGSRHETATRRACL